MMQADDISRKPAERSDKSVSITYTPDGSDHVFYSEPTIADKWRDTNGVYCNGIPLLSSSSSCSTLVISVVDNSTGHVHSPAVLLLNRCRDTVGRLAMNAFSPALSRNNIKIFGSKKCVKLERERSKASPYIIHPLSNFRLYWDFLIMLVMLLNMIVLPLDIAFFKKTHNCFLILSDAFCILDIILNFRTGYRASSERMSYELSTKKIALQYMKTWFAVDMLSALPLNHIIFLIHGEPEGPDGVQLGVKGAYALKVMKLLKLLRLIKLLRISRIIRGISMYEEIYRVTNTVIRYIKLIALMMILAHWNGCLHFLVPMLQDFPDGCWVSLCQLKEAEWYVQYGWALFKTLSHMLSIGYGRYTPELLTEALLTTFTMVTGATFYALFIAQSLAYMIESNYSKITYLEKMKQTGEYLSYRNIPDDLKERVLSYFAQKHNHRRYFNEEKVLEEVSKPIRDDIVRYICNDVISCVPFIKDIAPDKLSTILSLASSNVYLSGDIIAQEGDIGSDIYFVRHGEVEITAQDKLIETLNDGDYFGECNVLVERERLYSAKAIIPCEVIILPGNEFKKLFEVNELIHPLMKHGAICRLIRIYNRCRLFNADDEELLNEPTGNARPINDPTRRLYNLFKVYLEDLCDIDVDTIVSNDEKSLCPRTTQNYLDRLLGNVVQSHRVSHTECDITPSLIKESSI